MEEGAGVEFELWVYEWHPSLTRVTLLFQEDSFPPDFLIHIIVIAAIRMYKWLYSAEKSKYNKTY